MYRKPVVIPVVLAIAFLGMATFGVVGIQTASAVPLADTIPARDRITKTEGATSHEISLDAGWNMIF